MCLVKVKQYKEKKRTLNIFCHLLSLPPRSCHLLSLPPRSSSSPGSSQATNVNNLVHILLHISTCSFIHKPASTYETPWVLNSGALFSLQTQTWTLFSFWTLRRVLIEEQTHVVFEKIVEYIGETSATVDRLYGTSFQATQGPSVVRE